MDFRHPTRLSAKSAAIHSGY